MCELICFSCISVLFFFFPSLSDILSEEIECHSWRECESKNDVRTSSQTRIHHVFLFSVKYKVVWGVLEGTVILKYTDVQSQCLRSLPLFYFFPQLRKVSGATFRPRDGSLGPCVLWHSSPLLCSWPALCGETKVASMQVRHRRGRSNKTCSPWEKVS